MITREEEYKRRVALAQRAYKIGYYIGYGLVALGAASVIMAFWSGEWRWFVAAVPAYWVIKLAIKNAH